jgi:ribonuclease E
MSSKMLIDAAHPEETRVAVVRGNRLEDFDYESASRKQLKGNIYLAKVTRVEPSLQAAFVDYGGNRHGFLAFNEIHPDYYQIPVADRQALLEEEAEEESRAMAEEAAYDDESSRSWSRRRRSRKKSDAGAKQRSVEGRAETEQPSKDSQSEDTDAIALDSSELKQTVSEEFEPDEEGAQAQGENGDDAEQAMNGEANGGNLESVGLEDALEELPVRRTRRRRNYKIQEVIKRRQIILVQVVKEERGNKGAALTTYISLAGRYTVLMPNTARGGGISRKITNPSDRKRLRKIAGDLDVAPGMGLIIRTAGASRTKAEIKRDFEYLLRMWENIRDLTLQSTAPTLVYEEGNLIKRSIRDLYGKEINDVLVSGDEAYKEAKSFMKLLMPSHAKNVQPYREPEPIFVRHQIERQLGAMFSPHVTLKSGGYLVINQTEALVSVDVNSGRATREHSIEDTALRTNIEAADELARQLRLRDLAGLIVIDFIDMEERRNNRSVERRLKDALKHDRARIQVGRISPFGLLEMSRQRLRAGMLEGTTSPCAVCQGAGIVRSTESVALDVLRSLEDTLMSENKTNLVATTSYDAALYILNYKRTSLRDIEQRYEVGIEIAANNEFHGAQFTIERGSSADGEMRADSAAIHMDSSYHANDERDEDSGQKGSRRRRRRIGGRGGDRYEADAGQDSDGNDSEASESQEAYDSDEGSRRPRRRGRRGGRRSRGGRVGSRDTQRDEQAAAAETANESGTPDAEPAAAEKDARDSQPAVATAEAKTSSPKKDEKPAKTAKRSRKKSHDETQAKKGEKAAKQKAEEPEPEEAKKSGNGSTRSPKTQESEKPKEREPAAAQPEPQQPAEASTDNSEPKRGWWQRRS